MEITMSNIRLLQKVIENFDVVLPIVVMINEKKGAHEEDVKFTHRVNFIAYADEVKEREDFLCENGNFYLIHFSIYKHSYPSNT